MQRYPEYKESGVEWIGEIPEHWGNQGRLDDVSVRARSCNQ